MNNNEALAYWGLSFYPFDDSRNPQFFYASEQHKEALTRMIYLVRQGNVHLGLLSGDIGAGKTITAMVLQNQISSPDRVVLYLPNSHYDFKYLLADIIDKLADGKVEFDTFDEYVLTKAFIKIYRELIESENKTLVILLDEAQQLSQETLVKIRNFTNLGDEEEFHITFLLIGQPELRKMVKEIPEVNQRIALRFHLNYLAPEEILEYIRHRLRIAGHPSGDIFAPDTEQLLVQETKGIPRDINRFCRLALDNARAKGLQIVDKESLEEVIYDQRLQEEN